MCSLFHFPTGVVDLFESAFSANHFELPVRNQNSFQKNPINLAFRCNNHRLCVISFVDWSRSSMDRKLFYAPILAV